MTAGARRGARQGYDPVAGGTQTMSDPIGMMLAWKLRQCSRRGGSPAAHGQPVLWLSCAVVCAVAAACQLALGPAIRRRELAAGEQATERSG